MIATHLDEIVRDYTHELGDLREELGAERARREMAETTLREGMAEERRRREEAERERDDLRRELHALREPRESPVTASETPDGAEVWDRPTPYVASGPPVCATYVAINRYELLRLATLQLPREFLKRSSYLS